MLLWFAAGKDTDSLLSREHRPHAFLHFLRRDVFLMRGHPPQMPEGIFELAGAIAVKLVCDGLAFFGACGQRSFEKRVDVFDIEMDADGGPTERRRRLAAVLWEFIREHDQGIAQANFGMSEASVGQE